MTQTSPKTILVFGGAGFIGSHFVRYWRTTYPDWNVVVFDALTYSGDLARIAEYVDSKTRASRDPRVTFVEGDIADRDAVEQAFREFRPTYVVNFAAETHVDRSIHVGAENFIRTNVTGVFNILETVKKFGCEKFLQVSTDEVYGQLPLDEKDAKFTEDTQYRPNVPYSATKAAGDLLCNAYFFTWNVPVIVTHCSNNYGEWQYPEKFVPYMTFRLLENKSVPIYGDGKNVRDWMYVGDHVRALDLALWKGKLGEVYNFGANNERANLDIARSVISWMKAGSVGGYAAWMDHVEFVADRPGHDRRYAIDASKAIRELGWAPEVTADRFEAKLLEVVKWYEQHLAWCRDVQARTGVLNAHIDLWKKVMEPAKTS